MCVVILLKGKSINLFSDYDGIYTNYGKKQYTSQSVSKEETKTRSNLNRKSLIQIITKFNVELPLKGKNNLKEYSDGRMGSSPQL